MTDRQVYERALAELHRCEERAERLRVFVRTYEELAGVGRSTVDNPPERQTADIRSWEGYVIDALRHAGHPLRVREIYGLVGEALEINSERPIDVLSTRINRSANFKKVGRGLYTLRDDDERASGGDAQNVQNVERSTDVTSTSARENNTGTLQLQSEPRSKVDLMGTAAPIRGLLGLQDAVVGRHEFS